MTWIYGITGLAVVMVGLRWLLARGDEVHADLAEIRASRRSGGGSAPTTHMDALPQAPSVGRPGH